MADREKVIRGLECHATKGFVACQDCPYYPDELIYEDDDDMEGTICEEKLAADALALLKGKEPRVMTLEEVIHSKDWVWYQWKNTHCGWAIAVNCDGKWIEWEDSTTDQLCKYGEKWRCWTSRPSPKQMRETKWEDSDEKPV